MKTKYIQYEELLKKEETIKRLNEKGILIIPKKKKVLLGYTLIGLGLVTWFIPFTTIPLICLGVYLCGFSKYKLKEKIRRRLR